MDAEPLRVVSARQVDDLLDFPRLIEALRLAFSGGIHAPARHHHEIGSTHAAVHLLMPAWTATAPGPGNFVGTKIVNVFRNNSQLGLPAVQGSYLLQSGETGAPLALIDGTRLTVWRTAAASGLASSFLSRPESRHLLMVGAGALAPFLVRAHMAVRPIERVTLWNHRRAGAEALAETLRLYNVDVAVTENLPAAVRVADIISCATLSTKPLVEGAWLEPGQHLDLVGAFTLGMRETDDVALRRARVFVDTEGATHEGGDVAVGLRDGAIRRDDVIATLHDLCLSQATGRRDAADITLFKSIGAAIEDLAAAILVWQSFDRG